MKDAAEFGRLEDAMLYHVLPRVRRDDLKRESEPPVAPSTTTKSETRRRVQREEPALPCFALSDSVPSIRIAVRPPSPKFHVVCNYEDVSEHVLDYTSEAALPVHRIEATTTTEAAAERPSAAPLNACLREGARAPRAGSTIFFLALIALAVITMSIVALAVLVPGSDWALIQG